MLNGPLLNSIYDHFRGRRKKNWKSKGSRKKRDCRGRVNRRRNSSQMAPLSLRYVYCQYCDQAWTMAKTTGVWIVGNPGQVVRVGAELHKTLRIQAAFVINEFKLFVSRMQRMKTRSHKIWTHCAVSHTSASTCPSWILLVYITLWFKEIFLLPGQKAEFLFTVH